MAHGLDLARKYSILQQFKVYHICCILSVLTDKTESIFGQYTNFITFAVSFKYRNQSTKQNENKLKLQVK